MTEKAGSGTDGGKTGTNRFSARTLTWLLLGVLVIRGLIRITSNVYSYIADRSALGDQVNPLYAWLYESTSLAAWMIMLIPCWFAVRAIRPPRVGWLWASLLHLLLVIPLSFGHIALMVAFRLLAWWVMGDHYEFNSPDGTPTTYELRKDVATYVELVLTVFLIQWLVARYAAPAPETLPTAPLTLAVGDGSVTHHLPIAEIEHVAAAGNYVEIAWRGQRLLHRATLTAIEEELASAGFARIHRSRLVRKDAVRRVVTQKSGDFDVEMESGETLRGSRRFRENVEG
ncbi:LytTR family DNA-binding domain-containing protein [Sphingopyxis panaciterrae]